MVAVTLEREMCLSLDATAVINETKEDAELNLRQCMTRIVLRGVMKKMTCRVHFLPNLSNTRGRATVATETAMLATKVVCFLRVSIP